MEEDNSLTQGTILKAMDWAYEKAVKQISRLDSA